MLLVAILKVPRITKTECGSVYGWGKRVHHSKVWAGEDVVESAWACEEDLQQKKVALIILMIQEETAGHNWTIMGKRLPKKSGFRDRTMRFRPMVGEAWGHWSTLFMLANFSRTLAWDCYMSYHKLPLLQYMPSFCTSGMPLEPVASPMS
jgi:hypothetical protein